MPRWIFFLLTALLVACSPSSTPVTSATRPATKPKPVAARSTRPFTPPSPHDPQVAALIHQLVSDFPPAHETGWWPRLAVAATSTSDEAKQRKANSQRIQDAYEKLESLGLAAFPDLAANADDPRYSFSRIYAAWHNHSVGDACYLIMEEQIDSRDFGYKSRNAANGKSIIQPQYIWTMRETTGLPAWWQSRQTRSLRDLQIESLQWTINREQTAGFTDDAQRHQILDPLQTRLTDLQSSL
jgi:hypothetical protein